MLLPFGLPMKLSPAQEYNLYDVKKSDRFSRYGRIYGVTAQSKIVISNGNGAVWFRHTITLTEGVRDEKVKTIKANERYS